MPLKRIEAMIAGRKLDAACGLVRSDERIAAYKIPDTPLFSVNYHMLVRADDTVIAKNFDDVRKLNEDGVVLVNAGSGAIAALKKAGNLKIDSTANTTAQNIDKLLAGRGAFLLPHSRPGLGDQEGPARTEGADAAFGVRHAGFLHGAGTACRQRA